MTRARLVSSVSALVLSLSAAGARAEEPALLSFGVGYFDQPPIASSFNPSLNPSLESSIGAGLGRLDLSDPERRDASPDIRVEYHFGTSLLSATEPWATIKPWAGLEVTSDGAVYGVSGLRVDVPLGSFMLTPSAGIGLYDSGGGRDLGSVFEFRTQLGLGDRFGSDTRLSLSYRHVSNAGPTDAGPGGNTTSSNFIGLYLHLPTSGLFGQ